MALIVTCYLKCFCPEAYLWSFKLVNSKFKPYLEFVSSTNYTIILLYALIFGYVSWILSRFTLLKRSLMYCILYHLGTHWNGLWGVHTHPHQCNEREHVYHCVEHPLHRESTSWLLVLGSSAVSSLREAGSGSLATNLAWVMSSGSVLVVQALIGVAGVCDPMVISVGGYTCYMLPSGLASAAC